MAYLRKIKEKARRLWLEGYSYEKIAKKPDMPNRWKTIQDWACKENWQEELDIIVQKANEKRAEILSDELVRTTQLHRGQLQQAHTDINEARKKLQDLWKRWERNEEGKEQTPMHLNSIASAIRSLASTLDIIIKNERLITGLATNKEEVTGDVVVKGYIGLSPDDWDELKERNKNEI